jgi:hypothetical protein
VAQLSSRFHAANPSGTASLASFNGYFEAPAAGNLTKSFHSEMLASKVGKSPRSCLSKKRRFDTRLYSSVKRANSGGREWERPCSRVIQEGVMKN